MTIQCVENLKEMKGFSDMWDQVWRVGQIIEDELSYKE